MYSCIIIYLPALCVEWLRHSQMQDEPSTVQACHQAQSPSNVHEWCLSAAWHKLKHQWGITLAGLCRMVRVPVSLHAQWPL